MSEDKRTTILGHLRELRQRLVKSVIAVAITTVISFFFFEHIFNFLKVPAGNIELIFIEMTEGFGTYMRVCLVSGIILAMPYLMYHFLMFVTPALTRRERKMVFLILPWIILMFIGGVYFGYQYLIPPATKFLLSFSSKIAEPQIRIGNYVTFVARLLLAIGLAFELPVVTTFLARVGVISSKWLADRRRVMIIFVFILGAIITPTIDPINQSIVAGTLIVLYEISIWLAKIVERKKAQVVTSLPTPVP